MDTSVNKSYFFSPLRYPGGKNSIFKFFSKIFSDNDLIGCGYAEPYAGGAGLALRLLFDEYVNHIFINDFDKSIYAFWNTVLDDADAFCKWIKDVEVTTENWLKYKSVQSNLDMYSNFEIAQSTFFLNRTNISGVIKGGMIGGYNQQGKYKIDARFNKEDLINRIQKIYRFRDRITVSNMDGIAFIIKLNKMKKKVFIYLDPPYFQKGADLYMNFYVKKDHQKLSNFVSKMKQNWIVSYDNHEFILNLYEQHDKIIYQLSQGASNRVGDEVLIFSKNIHYQDAIKTLKSPVLL